MRYLSIILLLVSLAGVAAADSTSFGFDGSAASNTITTNYMIYVNAADPYTWTGPGIVVDSMGLTCRRVGMLGTGAYYHGVIYQAKSPNRGLSSCSLAVQSNDSVLCEYYPSTDWGNVTDIPQDTLRSGVGYYVGFIVNYAGGSHQYVYHNSGSTGDGYSYSNANSTAPATMTSFSVNANQYKMVAWGHTTDKDTVVYLHANSADSIGWEDTRLYQGNTDCGGAYGEWGICGDDGDNEQQAMLFRHDSLPTWMPDDRVVDSAWIRTCFLASGRTHTDTLHPNTRYLLRDWNVDTAQWTLYDIGSSWTNGGAASGGDDCADRVENADTVVRNAYGTWSDEIDTTGLSDSHDSADWWLSPVTLDSMNAGDLSNYGWRIGPDTVNNGQDKLGMRWHSRDYTSNPQYRPSIYIFMSEAEEEEPATEGPANARHSPDGAGVRHSPQGASARHEP